MSPESLDLARAWLKKAFSDLAAARLLIHGGQKHLDIGSYHCQQGAEKALKAYLTAHETIFPKTHVLEKLIDLCLPSDASFDLLRENARNLTPLGHEFRYPGDASEPSPKEAADALERAEEICSFCKQQLEKIAG